MCVTRFPDDPDSPLRTRPLVVVSNREPYVHRHTEAGVEVHTTPGGLTSALDPALRRLGGTWVAWGSGDADATAVDDRNVVAVPPDDPTYDLKRVFLTREQVDAHYYGYSNRVLWPLCHGDLDRTDADSPGWAGYVAVNGRFAEAVLDVLADLPDDPVVWIQDYQLALVPERLRRAVPETVTLSQFWHVPWPSAGTFAECPQRQRLLESLLANDLLGVHVEAYRENLLDCVERTLPSAVVDRDAGTVTYGGRTTRIYVHPIGIDVDSVYESVSGSALDSTDGSRFGNVRSRYGLDRSRRIVLTVDRLDYTKGIVQRLRAFEHLFRTRPAWRERTTHLMVSQPTRESIPAYREYRRRVEREVERLNDAFGEPGWQPIRHVTDHVPRTELYALCASAEVGLVSSVRDGLNLFGMEYAAASRETGGTLLLSEHAGLSDILDGAISIDPHDVTGTARRIEDALSRSDRERTRHAETMAEVVERYTVYDWIDAHDRLLVPMGDGKSVGWEGTDGGVRPDD